MMTVGAMCASIDGLGLGLEQAGMRVVWQVEVDPFRRGVLQRRFPGSIQHADLWEVNTDELCAVDVVAAGPPCQPVSRAGRRRGERDYRWLWPRALQIVAALRPRWGLFENPPGLVRLGLDRILSELEHLGYTCATLDIPAAAVDAPHIRSRLFILAHTDKPRLPVPEFGGQPGPTKRGEQPRPTAPEFGSAGLLASSPWAGARALRCNDGKTRRFPAAASGICPLAHGVPGRVAGIAAYGDAVVPEVARRIGCAMRFAQEAA